MGQWIDGFTAQLNKSEIDLSQITTLYLTGKKIEVTDGESTNLRTVKDVELKQKLDVSSFKAFQNRDGAVAHADSFWDDQRDKLLRMALPIYDVGVQLLNSDATDPSFLLTAINRIDYYQPEKVEGEEEKVAIRILELRGEAAMIKENNDLSHLQNFRILPSEIFEITEILSSSIAGKATKSELTQRSAEALNQGDIVEMEHKSNVITLILSIFVIFLALKLFEVRSNCQQLPYK